MDAHLVNFIYIIGMVLLPLIPAFIIFRYLPVGTGAEASTPSWMGSGLSVRFTGAFAGYTVLFFVLYLVITPLLQVPPDPTLKDWKIVGRITDMNTHDLPDEILSDLKFLVMPQPSPSANGKFSIPISTSILLVSDPSNRYNPLRSQEFGTRVSVKEKIIYLDTLRLVPKVNASVNELSKIVFKPHPVQP